MYADAPIDDPGDSRVLRGCFWGIDLSSDYFATCASRMCFRPGPGSNVGFRIARNITPQPITEPDVVSREPDIPAPQHVPAPRPPQAPHEILRKADKVLTLVHVERIESISADTTNLPSEQVERLNRLGISLIQAIAATPRKPGTLYTDVPLSDFKPLQNLLNGIESGPITFVLRWGPNPTLETLVATLGEPEKRVPGTIRYQNPASVVTGFPMSPTSELLQVEWYHWSWVAIAVGAAKQLLLVLAD